MKISLIKKLFMKILLLETFRSRSRSRKSVNYSAPAPAKKGGSGSGQTGRLRAAPAPQHCLYYPEQIVGGLYYPELNLNILNIP